LRDLLKASYVRTSIKLGILLTIAGLIVIWLLKVFNVAATPLFANLQTFFMNYGLAGIFLATILAGTIVPLGSPALVIVAAFFIDPIPLILIASIGFTIGMTINYALAYKLGRPFVAKRVAPNTSTKSHSMEQMGTSNLRHIRLNTNLTRGVTLVHLRTTKNTHLHLPLAQLHPKTHCLHINRLLWTVHRRMDRCIASRNYITN